MLMISLIASGFFSRTTFRTTLSESLSDNSMRMVKRPSSLFKFSVLLIADCPVATTKTLLLISGLLQINSTVF